MDFKALASRLGIEPEDFMELAELFVTTTEADMEKIARALAQDNSGDASAAAHSIKGAAANLGFEPMAELAKKMEIQGKAGDLSRFSQDLDQLRQLVQDLKGRI